LKVMTLPPPDLEQSRWWSRLAGRRNELFYILPFLAALIVLKLGLALWVWRSGFLEYDADGFTRSVIAWEVHTGQKKLQVDAWLPLQFLLNGWLMNFWPDLLRLPRLVNMLCSIGTTINFFFIGRFLFGRLNGYATALLVAIFPWEIWFGLSGMSESLTNFFLSLGLVFFCRWLTQPQAKVYWLALASIGFLGATMLRYEAWFYSVLFVLVSLYITWRRDNFKKWGWLKTGLALAPTFIFILLWMLFSWLDPDLHSPLGFVKLTSELNARIFGAENNSVGFLERLVYYPQIFWNLLYQLTIPAILGSLWLALRPVGAIRPYLALVWGEFALFILTTLPYNNIAPGSARYPVSNLLLLMPVVAYLLQWIFQRSSVWRWAALALFALLAGSLVVTTLDRAPRFPDDATRQASQWLRQRWQEGYLKSDEVVMLHLPAADGPRGADFTRAYYALRVLTNHPGNFKADLDTETFGRLTQNEQGDAPHVWVHLASADGMGNYYARNYREVVNFGDYWLGRFPLFRAGTATPESGPNGATFVLQADEYKENERTAAWISGPNNGKIIGLGNKRANEQGVITIDYTAKDMQPGEWSVTIVGQETRRRAIIHFFIT
jgi:hypothetical protein